MRTLLYLVFFLSLTFSAVAQEIKGDWKFPSDIAVANGKLYVVDGLNDRIAVYDLYGKHLADIKVKSPFGIAVKGGLIYVTSQRGELYVLDEFGNLEKSLKLRGRPIDVAVLKGKLFVSNGKGESVDVYTGEGELVTSFGGKGSAPGNFVGIFLLDSSKELLFAVDSVNGRVQEFNEKGDLVRSFGVFGIEEGDLFRPKGVAYCNGKLVVSDGIIGAVQLFDVYGGFERVVAKGLYYPTAVACYEGEVFVLEPLKKRVSIFRVQGVK
jgi:outer membrane protein assembly factor BamB